MNAPRLPRSRWIILVAALAAAAATAALGLWQLDRARQKIAMAQALASRVALAPIAVEQLAGSRLIELQSAGKVPPFEQQLQAQFGRRLLVQGRWLTQFSVYLDNRPMQGTAGLYLLTPLRLADGRVLMVQRGWSPRDAQDRTRVPPPPERSGLVSFTGRIATAPGRTFELGHGDDNGPIRQNLDVVEYGRSVGLAVQPLLIVQLDDDVDSGADGDGDTAHAAPPAPAASGVPELKRDWPQPAVDVAKHHGYAAQWFALCALIVILYVWFQLIRPRRQPS
jgi:surfeit locus 1 family protein